MIELADGGILLYSSQFFLKDWADRAFAELQQSVAWEQKPALYGHPQPRLTASYGDPGVSYTYSRVTQPALPWLPVLFEIKQRIEAVQGRFNYCLLNRYRTGSDSMGWHADDEAGLGPIIASISLGATRVFRLRHNQTRAIQRMDLTHGSLLIMAGTVQQFWQHEVPKTRKPVGERINLTYRWIESPSPAT